MLLSDEFVCRYACSLKHNMSVEEMAQKRYCHGVKADCTVQHDLDKKLFMTSNSKQCDVNYQVKQTHHKSNDDQVEKGHIISFPNTIV